MKFLLSFLPLVLLIGIALQLQSTDACRRGQRWVNNRCVWPGQNQNMCPAGQQWINNACAWPGQNICPIGQQLINGACVLFGFHHMAPPAAAQWQLPKENTAFHATSAALTKVKTFVENLHASIQRTGGRQNASIALMHPNEQAVWTEFEQMAVNAWDGQPEWNNTLNRVKGEILRVYTLNWTDPNGDKRRGGPNNWAYALYILRALLEYFKDIFTKGTPNPHFVYAICGAAWNPECLAALTRQNNENILSVDNWFTKQNSRDAEMTTAKGHYADYKMRILDFFIVNIVDVGPGQAMVPHAQYGHGVHMMGMLGPGIHMHNYYIGDTGAAAAPTPMLDRQNVSIDLNQDTITDIENFINKFNEKLPVVGNNANKALYSDYDMFGSFMRKTSSHWDGQMTINAAFTKIREFVSTAYDLKQLAFGRNRKFRENWTYDMYMLRALFELFNAIIEAAKAQLGTPGQPNYQRIVLLLCPMPIIYHSFPYTANTTPDCWAALAQKNTENINKIGEWFTQTAANPQAFRTALEIFQRGNQHWPDYQTKIANAFIATVTIPAGAAPAPQMAFGNFQQNHFMPQGGFGFPPQGFHQQFHQQHFGGYPHQPAVVAGGYQFWQA